MTYALTINKQHLTYNTDIKVVLSNLHKETDGIYIEIVNHSNDHYHALIQTTKDLNEQKGTQLYHIEVVRNVKAYQKYMNNHDVEDTYVYGEMTYTEPTNDDEIVEYALKHGAQKTVLKYGMKALKVYKTLKEFLNDYEHERSNT